MISAVAMAFAMIWMYQTLIKAKQKDMWLWMAGSAVAFIAAVWIMMVLQVDLIDGIQGKDIGDNYDRDLSSVGDRQTDEQGSGGAFLNGLFELLPPIAGFMAVALIRTLLILKQPLKPEYLFSGLKEMFFSIGNSFKSTSGKAAPAAEAATEAVAPVAQSTAPAAEETSAPVEASAESSTDSSASAND